MPAKCLTSHKPLPLKSSNSIAYRCQQQHDRGSNQARWICNDTKPLDQAHGSVDGGAHVIGGKTADEVVKGGRGGADAQ